MRACGPPPPRTKEGTSLVGEQLDRSTVKRTSMQMLYQLFAILV